MHSGSQTAVPVAHGDVKPSNIVLRQDGSTVLVDLGLTRLADGAGRVGRSRPYAAPEMFQPGARSTPEADRFAFAATVVHAILGEPPPVAETGGPDLATVQQRLQTNQNSARRLVLVSKLMEALTVPPTQRPANLRGWLSSLTDTLSQLTDSGGGAGVWPATGRTGETTITSSYVPDPATTLIPPQKPKSRRGLIVAIVATAIVLAAGGAVYGALSGKSSSGDPSAADKGGIGATAVATTEAAPPTTDPPPSPTESPSTTPSASATSSPGPVLTDPPGTEVFPTFDPALGTSISSDDFIASRHDMSYDTGNLEVNGKTSLTGFADGVCCYSDDTFQSTIDINLSRSYRVLTARLGLVDKSDADLAVRYQFYLDNKKVFDKSYRLGQSFDLKLDVTGALRLKIVITGKLAHVEAAVGDPTVYP